jgi:hypothetical protein
MGTVDRRGRRSDHLTAHCCHPSTAVHTTEMALLAGLISEHKIITGMLDYPDSEIDHILGLLYAHDGVAKNLVAWRAATAVS